jgi:P4 family phage/plasmid primase-like protien
LLTFLRGWSEEGPWWPTAIPREGGKTETRTFTDLGALAQWAGEKAGRFNLYFSVNDLAPDTASKASKEEVTRIRGLHVDVDPRPPANGWPKDPTPEQLAALALHFESERARIWAMMEDWERNGAKLPFPRPTAIVDSGGGFQCFWRLAEEVAPEVAEAVNMVIAEAMGGDATHDVSRIMRLPGAVNLPSDKKRRRGRGDAPTSLAWADWSRRFRLADFPPVAAQRAAPAVAGPTVAAQDVDLESLGLPDRVRALIVQGRDNDEPERWQDRSRLVMHVLCELIRADVPDGVIKAVILDPAYGISAHVLDQKRPERYADRQIQRALAEQPRPGPVLVPVALNLARAYRDARRPHLRHHQQEFLDWDGAAYVGCADDTVRAEVWTFLETCRVPTENEGPKPLMPKPETVSATVDALKAVAHLPPSREEPPLWLDGRAGPDPLDLLPTRSGLLHLPTGDLLPATPDLFTRNALDFAHQPAAPEPARWLAFLREVWPDPDEAECIVALQDFMGYLLTPDTSLQKALLMPGPKRSGKGTIGRVMSKLVGEANTVAPSLNSFGRSDFGLEPLLAKQLALVSDMRLSGRTDEAAVAENLLRITGEDRVSVNRKHRQAVEVTLRARFVVMTNEVPKFADRSGALVSRFIVLPMRQSFYGREDPGLTAALMAELPGILNWAVDGWRRVKARGRITQPEVGRDVALQMTDLSSPIPAFVRECCEVGGEFRVAKDHLFNAFRAWHRDRIGHDYIGGSNTWASMLYSATDNAVRAVKAGGDGGRVPSFGGIRLRPDAPYRPMDADPPF